MLKIKRKYKIIFLIVLPVAALTAWSLLRGKNKIEYETETIKRGNIVQTVSETGTVKAAKEIDLNFLNSGKIAKIMVKIGDQVKPGQVLAELNYSSLSLKEREARASLAIAQSNLNKLLAGSTKEDTEIILAGERQAEAAYQSALAEFDKVKQTNIEDIVQAEKILADLNSLDNITGANNKRDPIITAIDSKLPIAKSSLDQVKTILEDTSAKDYLSVQDLSQLTQTKANYNEAITLVAPAQSSLATAKTNKSDANLDQAVSDSLNLLNKTLTALNFCFSALEKSISGTTFSQTNLDTYKTSIAAYQTSVSTGISSVQTAQQNLKNALATAVNDLNSVKLAAEQKETTAQAKVDAGYNSWRVARAQLEKVKAPTRREDISLAQAQVAQAQASLEAVLIQINDSIIKAPIEGTVTKVNYEVGEQAVAGKAVISMLGENNFEIEVDISEADIVKIKTGDAVALTFDAFGEEVGFSGAVSFVEPAQTVIQDVIYYKTTIADIKLADGHGQNNGLTLSVNSIRPGMTANVTITTAVKENALIIPSRAIVEKGNNEKITRLLVNNQSVEAPIKIGLRGDNGLTEALSGVKEGDTVITFIKNNNK